MKLTLTTQKATGNSTPTSWAAGYEFAPEDPAKLSSHGQLFIVASSLAPTQGLLPILAREVASRLHDYYYGNTQLNVFNALKEAVKKTVDTYSNHGEIEIIATSFVKDVLYITATGGAQAWLFRKNMPAKLLSSKFGDIISVSGHPKPGDVLVLATSKFFSLIPQSTIFSALKKTDISPAIESFRNTLKSNPDATSAGIKLIQFSHQKHLPSVASVATTLDKVISAIPDKRLVVHPDTKGLEEQKKSRVAAMVGGMLLTLLIVSIIFGLRQSKITQKRDLYEARLSEAVHQFEEAQNLVNLNPSRARELVLSSKKTALTLKEEGVSDVALDELLNQLNSGIGAIAGIYEVSPSLYLDLSLIASGFQGHAIDLSEGGMLVLDRKGKRLVEIALDTKKTKVLAGPNLIPDAVDSAIFANQNFVLVNDGVYEVGDDEIVIEKDWDGDVLIHAYAGNIYLVDKAEDVLWRYSGVKNGFAQPTNWFGPGVEPDLSDTSQIAVDGSIWILSNSGRILKFTNGSPQTFTLSTPDSDNISISDVYTDEYTKYLYILDRDNSRVLVVDKDGLFKAEYISDEIKNVSKIVVSEEEQKIILLTGPKLLEIKLKHL